jgi:hypothetical protein
MNADMVNGIFETLAGVMVSLHCWQLYKDKMVRGVNLFATMFFTSWGIWNLYYYPSLHQWFSFVGGLAVVTANVVWVWLMIYYKRKEAVAPAMPSAKAAA